MHDYVKPQNDFIRPCGYVRHDFDDADDAVGIS